MHLAHFHSGLQQPGNRQCIFLAKLLYFVFPSATFTSHWGRKRKYLIFFKHIGFHFQKISWLFLELYVFRIWLESSDTSLWDSQEKHRIGISICVLLLHTEYSTLIDMSVGIIVCMPSRAVEWAAILLCPGDSGFLDRKIGYASRDFFIVFSSHPVNARIICRKEPQPLSPTFSQIPYSLYLERLTCWVLL